MGLMATDRIQEQEARLRGTAKVDFANRLDLDLLGSKTVVVTGGASGIGLGIATALAKRGASVAIMDLTEDAGLKVQKDLSAKGQTVKFFRTDVTSWDSQLAAFKEVLVWSGNNLDIVVLSAGVRSHNIRDLVCNQDPTIDPIRPPSTTLDVNLLGVYYTTHLALTYFTRLASQSSVERKWKPQLLFICSLAGYAEQSLSADYCASKYGVRGVWKAIRSQGALFGGCQANLLAPTFSNTRGRSDRERAHLIDEVRLAEVEDVVAGALRCICDDAVEARAVCCVQGAPGSPGSNNFDLCDNTEDYNSGKALLEAIRAGVLGKFGRKS